MNNDFINIPEFIGHYQINKDGIVRSIKFKKIVYLKTYKNNNGYIRVHLFKNNKVYYFSLHRLIMLTFKPDEYFEGAIVNHKNEIRDDNRLDNLEWCTHKENSKHSYKNHINNVPRKEKHYRSKINQKIANIIKLAIKNNYLNSNELQNIFNIKGTTISHIINNKRWIS